MMWLPVQRVLNANRHCQLLDRAISLLAPILDHVAIDPCATHRRPRLSNAHRPEAVINRNRGRLNKMSNTDSNIVNRVHSSD